MADGRLTSVLTPGELDVFDNSLERCVAHPQFMDRFYEIFIGSSEEVREKFRHTNLRKQAKMVKASLYMLLMATQGMPEADMHFQRIAKLHGNEKLKISPELYELWMDSLIQAVQEHDEHWRSETEHVWRTLMGAGIKIMLGQA
jgi:hemoglobin-like flavoprotein